MPNNVISITAAYGLATLISTMLLALVKPFIERIPGIMLASNQDVHDNLLRLILYLLNYAFLLAALFSGFLPGFNWFILLPVALGQTLTAHATFKLNTKGRVPLNAPAPLVVAPQDPGASPSFGRENPFPTVPRP